MGLLDRIRGVGDRPASSTSSGVTVRPTPARPDSDLAPTPSRGDAWTLPGLKTTMRPMPTIIDPVASMLVTRRPTAVVEPEVRHGVDLRVSGEVLSGVIARATGSAPEAPLSVRTAPKSKKSRAPESAFVAPEVHEPTGPTFTPGPQIERTEPRGTDLSPTPVIPRMISARPTGQMPSIKEVRSGISFKAPEPVAPKRPAIMDTLDDGADGAESSRSGRRMKWDDLVAAPEPAAEPTPEPSPNRRRGNAPPISLDATPAPAAKATAPRPTAPSPQATPLPPLPVPAPAADAWPTTPAISPTAGRTNALPDLSAFGVIPGVTTGLGAAPQPPAPRPPAATPPVSGAAPAVRARRSRGFIAPESTDEPTPAKPTPPTPAPAKSTPATSAPQLRSRDAESSAAPLPAGHTHDDGHDHGHGPSGPDDTDGHATSRPISSAEPLLRGRDTTTAQEPSDRTSSPQSPGRPDLVTHTSPAQTPLADETSRVDLAHDIRSHIESEVGASPAAVEVRQGPTADRKAREFNAEAFTDGGVVHLAADRPLSSARGRQLLAHEATHVVQQTSGTTASREKLENQARRVESRAGGPQAPSQRASSGAQSGNTPAASSVPVSSAAPALSSRASSPVAASTSGAPLSAPAPSPSAARVTAPSPAQRRTPSLVGSRSTVSTPASTGITSDVSATTSATSPGSSTTSFGDSNHVTVPNAPASEPTDLKVAQQPKAVAAAVATQVAREAISASPAMSAPLLRSRTDDSETENPFSRGSMGGLDDTSSASSSSVTKPPAKSSGSGSGKKSGPSGGGHENEFGEEQASCACSGESRDTAHDRAWLETHARALYPFIRAEIRGELLRDRERRGRLMREQR